MLNQRQEFDHFSRIIRDPKFRSQFTAPRPKDFECGKFLWAGFDEGATVLIQRVVLGLEAWIPMAVGIELGCQRRLTKDLLDQLAEPFRIGTGKKSAADCYYNRAPSLIDRKHALSVSRPDLWKLVDSFYRDVRNKIFHGHFVRDITPEILDEVVSVFSDVYGWCDSWCKVIDRLNEIGAGKHGTPSAKQQKST